MLLYELNFNETDINFCPWRVKELYICDAGLLSWNQVQAFHKVPLIVSSGGGMGLDSAIFVWSCG